MPLKMLSRYIALVLCILICSDGVTQVATIEWQKKFGGTENDAAYSIQPTKDGGFIVAGGALSYNGDASDNHGNYDCLVLKLNKAGAIEWKQCYGGSEYDIARAIIQTSDNGYIMCGTSMSQDGDVSVNRGKKDFWVVKLTEKGTIEWEKSFGGSEDDNARSICETSSGDYIVGGSTLSNDGDVKGFHTSASKTTGIRTVIEVEDMWLIKLSKKGEVHWFKCMGTTGIDVLHSVRKSNDGGVILTSYLKGDNAIGGWGINEYPHFEVVKLDGEGNVQWRKDYFGNFGVVPGSLEQTSDGNFIISVASDLTITKLDHNGKILFEKVLKNKESKNQYKESYVRETSDGGFIAIGTFPERISGVAGTDGKYWRMYYHVIKLDKYLRFKWQREFKNIEFKHLSDICAVNDTSFVVSGVIDATERKDDMHLLKFNVFSSYPPDTFYVENVVVKFENTQLRIRWQGFNVNKSTVYSIQKGLNPDVFTTIGTIKSESLSEGPVNYTFTENPVPPKDNSTWFYRIQAVHFEEDKPKKVLNSPPVKFTYQ